MGGARREGGPPCVLVLWVGRRPGPWTCRSLSRSYRVLAAHPAGALLGWSRFAPRPLRYPSPVDRPEEFLAFVAGACRWFATTRCSRWTRTSSSSRVERPPNSRKRGSSGPTRGSTWPVRQGQARGEPRRRPESGAPGGPTKPRPRAEDGPCSRPSKRAPRAPGEREPGRRGWSAPRRSGLRRSGAPTATAPWSRSSSRSAMERPLRSRARRVRRRRGARDPLPLPAGSAPPFDVGASRWCPRSCRRAAPARAGRLRRVASPAPSSGGGEMLVHDVNLRPLVHRVRDPGGGSG